MAARKRIGMFLLATGLLLLAVSGVLWRGDVSRRGEIRAGQAAIEDSLGLVHDELVQTSLRYRGFQSSLSSMPDTVQRYGGKKTMEIASGYSKTIHKLEMIERDLKLQITALKREAERERAKARERTVPAAAGGAAATVVGALLIFVSRRRVGA